MGTRASFWIGDPRDLENRKWLGCIAMDGYPDGHPEEFKILESKTSGEFAERVSAIGDKVNHFTPPGNGSAWPFPWDDDIFLTEYTYAFFDEQVQIACFHHKFVSGLDYVRWISEDHGDDEYLFGDDDMLPRNIPAPGKYDSCLPDSIMVVGVGPRGMTVCCTADNDD